MYQIRGGVGKRGEIRSFSASETSLVAQISTQTI